MGRRLQRDRRSTRDERRARSVPVRQVSWGLGGAMMCEACKIFVLPCQCCIPPTAATECPVCFGPVVEI